MFRVILAVLALGAAGARAEQATCDKLMCPEGYSIIKAHIYGGNKCSQHALTNGGVAGSEDLVKAGCLSIADCGWNDGECFMDKCRVNHDAATCAAATDNEDNPCLFIEGLDICHKNCDAGSCVGVHPTSDLKCAGETCTLEADLATCCNAAQCGPYVSPWASPRNRGEGTGGWG